MLLNSQFLLISFIFLYPTFKLFKDMGKDKNDIAS